METIRVFHHLSKSLILLTSMIRFISKGIYWLSMQSETSDISATVVSVNESQENSLNAKDWEVGMYQDEVAASQGIRIRRRPLTGPPLHYVGPFEFRLQNEGNTPRNILEEIIWHKDKEVSQAIDYNFFFFFVVYQAGNICVLF